MSNDIATLKSRSKVNQCHWKWHHSIDLIWFPFSVLYSNIVHEIFDFKYTVTLKTGLRVSQGHWKCHHSSAYDFLLTFHSNHRPISYRIRDRRRFPSKITKFFHSLVFCAPAESVPLRIRYRRTVSKKLKWWDYQAEQYFFIHSYILQFDDIFGRVDTMHQSDRRTDTGPHAAKTALTHSVAR